MKDRFTGKSRGFGFVTFVDPAAAQRALTLDHSVDGRRCEAKIALPKVREGDAGGRLGLLGLLLVVVGAAPCACVPSIRQCWWCMGTPCCQCAAHASFGCAL
jgi:RNA recognition motif-containing protein